MKVSDAEGVVKFMTIDTYIMKLNRVCSVGPGFCHEQCATSSTVHRDQDVEFLINCKHCCETRATAQVQRSCGSPTSPLLLQGREFRNAGSSASAGTLEYSAEMKSTNDSKTAKKSSKQNKHWGLIWRKNNTEDTGIDFRLKNIILSGNPDMDLTKPVCCICSKPYNAELMYIRCEACHRKLVHNNEHLRNLLFITLFLHMHKSLITWFLCPLQAGTMLKP